MKQSQDKQLIADIKQLLDSQTLDSDTRLALQKARATAFSREAKSWWQLPWLQFAVSASLIAVLAINLPNRKSAPTLAIKPETVAVSYSPIKEPVKVVATTVEQPTAIKSTALQASVDIDLLENLELYEDAEFYQWLSEQDTQGVSDA